MSRKHIMSTVTAATCAVMLAAAAPPSWASAEPQALLQMQKYCVASWRNARIDMQEWNDATQQTLVDLLTRIPRERLSIAIDNPESTERRELTRSIWCTVQRFRRARHTASLDETLMADPAAPTFPSAPIESSELRESICSDEAGLSARQQEILMHLLDGSSVREIAETMDLPPARVSDEKYKAVRKLRTYFAEQGEPLDLA